MKDKYLKLRIEEKRRETFADKVGKRNMSKVLLRFIDKVNATNKKDVKDPHLFI